MPNDTMRIWDAVSKTDPAHTKQVEYGRKFTSIDAHWQIMQATKLFGPVGEGWGYTPSHSTLTLTPEIILAVADVTIWWSDGVVKRHEYGPIRATCEMYAPKTKFGKVIPGEFVTDEDAPKKAMTDALTKGLSHLGFSADVFLKLFDDNRYVQRMKQEFAGAAGAAPQPAPSSPAPGPSSANGRRMAADDPHLVDATRAKGALPATTGPLGGREATATEARAVKVKNATDERVNFLNATKVWVQSNLDQFWTDNAVWIDWMSDPKNGFIKEYERFTDAWNFAAKNARVVELA